MSLTKQLWLTLLAILCIAFSSSLLVGLSTLQRYTMQELQIKNADNANALALTLSQLDKDPVLMELLISAQFDTGYYRRIELQDVEGNTIVQREAPEQLDDVPGWFVERQRFTIQPGEAVVQNAWQQYGSVSVESHHSYAYRALWHNTQRLAGWFLLAALLSALLGWWLIRAIRRPLLAVIEQADAISQRRFTTSREPRMLELRQVVRAMNRLSVTVRDMLSQESQLLDRLRSKLQQDPVTGVANRDYFLQRLSNTLNGESSQGEGALAILRVVRLAELNQRLGHQATDALLATVTQTLHGLINPEEGGEIGRLNGSDFILMLPGSEELPTVAQRLRSALDSVATSAPFPIGLPMALMHYDIDDQPGHLLSCLDGALARASEEGDIAWVAVPGSAKQALYTTQEAWRVAIDQAIEEGIRFAHYPVLDKAGNTLHFESPSRLKLRDEWRPAGIFLPWLSRLSKSVDYDLAVLHAALVSIKAQGKPLAINLSRYAAKESRFALQAKRLLAQYPAEAGNLWLEIPESVVKHDLDGFRELCRELRPYGCHLGLEHVGPKFTCIADLHDVGLSYLKIDTSLVADIAEQVQKQAVLRGITTLAHSLGITVIGEGVQNAAEATLLLELGLDGVTGPGVVTPDTPEEIR
ncbi:MULTISPECIES: EAL domain-containing protein [Halomonadaceae]|uniref:EAL domain-containing protein n=1 Tax=Halomonadaceae TaxID=28256 RepID=UPI001598331F|nr:MULTISPECIES: LapD/MoxY N-terminal periplasmic domain-containing protein [Halomonas]QJQ96517.1 EAL domain-containing protein [Halomonas sp. PA5]